MIQLTEPHVLVADDSENNRFLIKAYLQREGYGIEIAKDGSAAVLKVQSKRYDVVLMDVQMPMKDGYAATREIRAWETSTGLAPVPIIALTANAMPGEETRSREAGCSGYLSKPVSRSRLLAELDRHLRPSRVNEDEEKLASLPAEIQARVPLYLAGRKQEIALIRSLLDGGLWEQIQRLAHNIKGSGSGYGFPKITCIGRELERAAKSQDAERVSAQLASLESVLNRAEPSR
ncbi:MAG: response regulator [Acidobacteriota bacterium]|nr:response regulator [Acidobacteriota bacterium]